MFIGLLSALYMLNSVQERSWSFPAVFEVYLGFEDRCLAQRLQLDRTIGLRYAVNWRKLYSKQKTAEKRFVNDTKRLKR